MKFHKYNKLYNKLTKQQWRSSYCMQTTQQKSFRHFSLQSNCSEGSIRLRSEAASGGARKAEGSSHVAQPEGNRSSTPAVGKPGKVKLKIRNMVPKPNPDAVDSSRSLPAKPPRPRPVDSRHQQKVVFIWYSVLAFAPNSYIICFEKRISRLSEIKWKTSRIC